MPRPRSSADHMAPTAPGPGERPNDRNSQQRRRGTRFYRGKRPKHQRRPYTRKPENSHSYGDSFSVPQWPRQRTETLALGLHPRTFDALYAERQNLTDALQAQDKRALELFQQLTAVEADIEYYSRKPQQDQQQLYQQHNQHPNKNSNVKVKVDGIPVSETNDRARREEAEMNQEKLEAAYRQRLWLHRQIRSTVDAERNILMRFGELQVETRCRERWCQVEREQLEMLHAPEPGYDGFGSGYIPYQQSQWHQNTDQTTPLYPDMYLYQTGCYGYNFKDANAGYNQVLSPSCMWFDSSVRLSEYERGGHQNYGESALIGAQSCEPSNRHADGGRGTWQPASYPAGRGQEDHLDEADKKWIGGMADCTWRDWRLVPENSSNTRRRSFP
ncbi:hypothetical protein F4860DRAFT_196240 [Xylaria cubensis]|nr:hypothetical protein F4860DRAFT_196240 [Xylaria cubensis]